MQSEVGWRYAGCRVPNYVSDGAVADVNQAQSVHRQHMLTCVCVQGVRTASKACLQNLSLTLYKGIILTL